MSDDDNKPEPRALVCRNATAALTLPGSDYSRQCSQCGVRLMLSPDGQRRLSKDPTLLLFCACCFLGRYQPGWKVILPEVEDVREANRKAIPNTWRERN